MAGAGKFVWYELMTSDLDAAEKFYRDVVGWKMKDAGMPMRYTLAHAGDVPVGGMMTIPPDARDAGHGPAGSVMSASMTSTLTPSGSKTKAARFIASPPISRVSAASPLSAIRRA